MIASIPTPLFTLCRFYYVITFVRMFYTVGAGKRILEYNIYCSILYTPMMRRIESIKHRQHAHHNTTDRSTQHGAFAALARTAGNRVQQIEISPSLPSEFQE